MHLSKPLSVDRDKTPATETPGIEHRRPRHFRRGRRIVASLPMAALLAVTASCSDGGADWAAVPACESGEPTFSVCFVKDTDVLPVPTGSGEPLFTASGTATVEAVGVGSAPAQCESARVFGARRTSDWWLQIRLGGNLWTIGVQGLGGSPGLQVGDDVAFAVRYMGFTASFGFGPPQGQMSLVDAAGAPILLAIAGYSDATWFTVKSNGRPVCAFPADSCDLGRTEMTVTVNGASATLPPFGAADVGGFHAAIGDTTVEAPGRCADNFGPGFYAGASKLVP